jgi:site-specific DNA recombinase
MAKSKTLQAFKDDFDALATNGSIGDPGGQPAYLYIRVSSDGQAEEGRSGLPRQIEHCHQIASEKGYKIPWELVFADDDSGFEFEGRPALSKLRQEIRSPSRRANTVVMEHLDRLSRDALWHQGYLLDEMQKYGIKDVFWKPFSSRIERAVMGVIAQEGMEHEIERMRDGMLKKAKRGRITTKTPALGMKLVDPQGRQNTMEARKETCYAIEEDRAGVIRFIYDAIANKGMSSYELAKALDERAKVDRLFKPPRAAAWGVRTIIKIIRTPLYKGEYIANRYHRERVTVQDKNGIPTRKWKSCERPESEWIRTKVPAIVDEATWELANKNLFKNKGFARRNKRYSYLLTGLIRCATCGWRYHGHTSSVCPQKRQYKQVQRYYCSKIHTTPAKREAQPCGQPSIRCEVLDAAIWKVISEALLNPALVIAAIDAKYAGDAVQAIHEQIAFVEREIQEKAAEADKLYKAYLAEAFTAEEFAAERQQLTKQRDTLSGELQHLRSQILTPEELAEKKEATIRLLDQARNSVDLANAPFALKHQLIKLLVDDIVLNTKEGWFEMKGIIAEGFFPLAADPVVSTSKDRNI